MHHLVDGCCIAEVVTQEKLTTGKNRRPLLIGGLTSGLLPRCRKQ